MRCTVHTRGKHGRESCTGELVLSRGASPGRASIDDRAGDGTIDGTPESLHSCSTKRKRSPDVRPHRAPDLPPGTEVHRRGSGKYKRPL